MKKIALSALVGLSFGVANAGVLEVKSFSVSGDCSEENTIGILTDDDDCNIIFNDMTAATNGDLEIKKCGFRAAIRVPEGYQIAADAMTLDGEFSVGDSHDSLVGLSTDYQMEGVGQKIMWMRETGDRDPDKFPRGETDAFSLSKNADPIVYAACGEDVVFTGSLSIHAQGNGSAINLDQSVAKWDWKLRKCDEYPKRWDSTYRAANGKDIHAIIEFDGSRGTYRLDSGQVGTFNRVQYKNDVIEGYWQFGHHTGWFRFRLIDDREYFSGSWGYGTIGSSPKGHWSGSRL